MHVCPTVLAYITMPVYTTAAVCATAPVDTTVPLYTSMLMCTTLAASVPVSYTHLTLPTILLV
eukprot:9218716-Pyramimonas_sp.AAC.1